MAEFTCSECSFSLWIPVAPLGVSFLGLYDDNRFPGRCILALQPHYESWQDIPSSVLNPFVADSQLAARAITVATGANRVNLAVLGNADPHVHFHMIPRYPDREELPSRSPWDDPRPKGSLGLESGVLVSRIRDALRDAGVQG